MDLRTKNTLGYYLLACALILVVLGMLSIMAAAPLKGLELFNDPSYYLKKQFLAAILGIFILIAMLSLPNHLIERMVLPLVLVTLLLLLLTASTKLSHQAGGASRWLKLFGISIQASELAKVALVFFLAKNLSRTKINLSRLGFDIYSNFIVLGLFACLLMKQPDFGTAFLLTLLTFTMLFLAGIGLKPMLQLCSVAGIGGLAILISAPYRVKRLFSYLDPFLDFQNSGFQIVQSYLAFQNGGLLGVGFGESRQKLFFLPEAHTDFILAVIGEELGLLGTSLVLLLFFLIFQIGILITLQQKTKFRYLLAAGLTCLITIQAFFNIGVVTGALPTKGITLPFISSGVSSLLTFFFAMAILARLGIGSIQKNELESIHQ